MALFSMSTLCSHSWYGHIIYQKAVTILAKKPDAIELLATLTLGVLLEIGSSEMPVPSLGVPFFLPLSELFLSLSFSISYFIFLAPADFLGALSFPFLDDAMFERFIQEGLVTHPTPTIHLTFQKACHRQLQKASETLPQCGNASNMSLHF